MKCKFCNKSFKRLRSQLYCDEHKRLPYEQNDKHWKRLAKKYWKLLDKLATNTLEVKKGGI